MTRPVCENCARPSCSTRAPKYGPVPVHLMFFRTRAHINAADLALTPLFNNPMPEQTFLAKNYDENALRADRDPCGIFRTPTDPSASCARRHPPVSSDPWARRLSHARLSTAHWRRWRAAARPPCLAASAPEGAQACRRRLPLGAWRA